MFEIEIGNLRIAWGRVQNTLRDKVTKQIIEGQVAYGVRIEWIAERY